MTETSKENNPLKKHQRFDNIELSKPIPVNNETYKINYVQMWDRKIMKKKETRKECYEKKNKCRYMQ